MAGLLLCLAVALILLCQFYGITLCPLRKYTGIPCFTCGSTRALLALAAGDFKTAFLTQPLVVSFFCLVSPLLAFTVGSAVVQKRIILVSLSRTEKIVLLSILTALTLLNWLYLLSTRR